MTAHSTGNPFAMACAVHAPSALTYEDYIAIGRERVLADITAAAASWGRTPDMSQLDRLARIYAEQDAPAAVRREYCDRKAAERASEFGPASTRPLYPMVLS